MEGSRRIWKVLEGYARFSKDMEGSKDMEDSRMICKVLEGYARF